MTRETGGPSESSNEVPRVNGRLHPDTTMRARSLDLKGGSKMFPLLSQGSSPSLTGTVAVPSPSPTFTRLPSQNCMSHLRAST